MTVDPAVPAEFARAVAGLSQALIRPEVELEPLPPPGRLAPFSHAISAAVIDPQTSEEIAGGRFVLLYDPAGVSAWQGTTRVIVFTTSETETDIASDPMVAEAAWSWLTDALAANEVPHTALGGTVTSTSSTRFGDLTGTRRTDDIEIRASWTALSGESGPHMTAFSQLLAMAAGLPPIGVATIGAVPTWSPH